MQYQVQEMLRTERIFEPEGIAEELAAYNPLIPDGSNWKVTLLLEFEPEARPPALASLKGVEDRCWVQVQRPRARVRDRRRGLQRENAEKTAAVHFLRFELDAPMSAALPRGGAGRRHRPRALPPRDRPGGRGGARARWSADLDLANAPPIVARKSAHACAKIAPRAAALHGRATDTLTTDEPVLYRFRHRGPERTRARPAPAGHVHPHLAPESPGARGHRQQRRRGHRRLLQGRSTSRSYKDGSLQVADDGRGMPVDIHPKEKVSGAELILTRLHAGGKFSDTTYKFSGGLHGVGVSVVNALSKHLECWIRRGGKEYNIAFKDGKITSKLEEIGTVGQRNTGTTVRFWPDPKFFDSDKFSVPPLKHALKAKAVLCPGLRITFKNEASGEKDEWFYTGDLGAYLVEELRQGRAHPGRADHRHAHRGQRCGRLRAVLGAGCGSCRSGRATST